MEIIENIKLDPIAISKHFSQLGNDFINNLEKSVDKDLYAAKLSELSRMNAVLVNQEVIALIAYYQNYEKKEKFISHVGVIPLWQNKGLASNLVKTVIEASPGFRISLEVVEENLVARKLYETLNFKVSAIFGSTLTLERFS